MKPALALPRRIDPDAVARAVVVVASVWFAFTAVWGICSVPSAGHIDAGASATTMAGEQAIRFKIFYPAWGWYSGSTPTKADYYCTHPLGLWWMQSILFWLFGHRDFILHLPAALMSSAIPPLLYGIAKARWGRQVGAVAAASYVVVPIAVGFSNFWNLETLTIFGALLFFWGHSRHLETGGRRHLLASLAGLTVLCCGDWVGYLIAAVPLAWAFVRAFVLSPRLTPRLRFPSYARWWAASVAIVAATLLLWIGLMVHADRIGAWLQQGEMRAGGEMKTLDQVLAARKFWIDFSFTPLAIRLGKIAAPVCLLLLPLTRRDEETYPLAILFGAVFQYVVFKRGADVHIFWPHYFAPYFALSVAWVVGAAATAARWGLRGVAPLRGPAIVAWSSLAIGLLPAILMAPDGVRSLAIWRRTGGKYDESLKRSNVDLLVPLREVVRRQSPPGAKVDVHPSVGFGWEHQWSLYADGNGAGAPSVGSPTVAAHPFWVARGSGLTSDEAKKIAAAAHVRIYGDTWIVDQREGPAPTDAFSLNEREPGPIEWLFVNGTEPVRSVGTAPDPWLTWEWRTHLGQSATQPSGAPRDMAQVRIAHNAAIERGDRPAAQKWLEQIEASLDRTVQARFEPGLRLIGIRKIGGVQPRLEAWFECTAPLHDASFNVGAVVEARARLSLIPPDTTGRELAFPPSMPTGLWRTGYLYTSEVVLNHLIGRERYAGYWASHDGSRAPQRADGQQYTPLAVLP